MEAQESKRSEEEKDVSEETLKPSRRKPRAKAKASLAKKLADCCEGFCSGTCANLNVKSIWVVGIAVIVLVSIFCFAMISNTGKSVPQGASMVMQPVAMTIPPEGFMPYQMDPLVQWGMQGMQPAAVYGPNCPIYPQAGTPQQAAPARPYYGNGGYYGNNPNVVPYYPQTAVQPVAMVQPVPQTVPQAPAIFRDAVMQHEYRGVCENCHRIL